MNKTIYEEGIEKGLKQGVKQGRKEGIEKGIEKGMERGMEKGMEQGMEQGRVELFEMAVNLLEGRFGPLPAKVLADLKSRSRQELRSMITNSFRIKSLKALDFDELK